MVLVVHVAEKFLGRPGVEVALHRRREDRW
jgi:hypothetical protein